MALTPPTATAWSALDKGGFHIGVTLGTSVDHTVTERLKSASICRFPDNNDAVAAVAAKRVDASAQLDSIEANALYGGRISGRRPCRRTASAPQ